METHGGEGPGALEPNGERLDTDVLGELMNPALAVVEHRCPTCGVMHALPQTVVRSAGQRRPRWEQQQLQL